MRGREERRLAPEETGVKVYSNEEEKTYKKKRSGYITKAASTGSIKRKHQEKASEINIRKALRRN